jgi:NAD(P)-dependent dehydrogenase (short-subunit alcohol dehydrogenase family)
MSQFKGKVALVTGGNAGIGRAIALAFAKEGAKVVVAARRQEEGEETVKQINENGSEAIFVRTDVAKESDVKAMVKKAVDTYGRLDFAINNAGILQEIQPLVEQSEETFDRVMDINAKGVFLSMKHEVPELLKNGGTIVNMSSILGSIGVAGVGIYVASKHAVIGLTKAAALEFAKSGIRVNAIAPAAIETDMYNSFIKGDEEKKKAFENLHPIGRAGKPEEIASAAVWLCSQGASFVTGQTIFVDGGYTIQ